MNQALIIEWETYKKYKYTQDTDLIAIEKHFSTFIYFSKQDRMSKINGTNNDEYCFGELLRPIRVVSGL